MSHPVSLVTTAVCSVLIGAFSLTAGNPSAQAPPAPPHGPRVAVFFEAGFPSIDIEPIPESAIREALAGIDMTFLGAGRLSTDLDASRFDVLVMPFGSAFPEASWPAILLFLEAGGSWVNLGGRPFAVGVSGGAGSWRAGPESSACYKALGFTHIFEVPATAVASWAVPAGATPAPPPALAAGFRADVIYAADIRLTSTKSFPEEDGSDGQREGRVQPLVVGLDDAGTPVAAPVIRVDRLAGRFSGGAWLLANVKGRLAPASVRTLVDAASLGALELSARPTFAGYQPGEPPTIEVALRRARSTGNEPPPAQATLTLVDPTGGTTTTTTTMLAGPAAFATAHVPLSPVQRPLGRGLHEVRVSVTVDVPGSPGATARLNCSTGFWVYDAAMLQGGRPLVATKDGFTRDGRPFPVVGTTYMASDVHRQFLLEPNPFLWNRDFAAMRTAGVNLVRTGIWTGWKVYMPDVGRMNEAALRALDVFLLTARRHDIPVIFTLFAFLPEAWGGENPYLDLRAVTAQQAFAGILAQRYAKTDDLAWDLINEPSFSSAAQLWKTRPNGDASESAAWQQWLRERYAVDGGDHGAAARRAWGAAPDEGIGLPTLDDFADRNLFGAVRPRKAADYKRFSQDMFTAWVRRMTEALRSNGNRAQLVTVGQDEGGLSERPNPLFFGREVDFTCMHTWWNNDALAWDAVLSRLPDRPMLVEETGLMRYERIDGTPWRTELQAAALLERKLAIAIGAGGSGFVQWIWNTNPYMPSDNEAGIGFFRADGTARPELAPFVRISRFLTEHAGRFRGREPEDVVLVIPHSQMFSPRSQAVEATQRAVRVLTNHLHVQARAVSDERLGATLGSPRLIIAPSSRIMSDAAWQGLLAAVEKGATLLVTGIIDTDEQWQAVERTRSLGIAARSRPVAGSENLMIDGKPFRLGFRGDTLERVETASVHGEATATLHRVARGRGMILWLPLPIELSDSTEAVASVYRTALAYAAVRPAVVVAPEDPGLFVGTTTFADAVLVVVASESSADVDVRVSMAPATGGNTAAGRVAPGTAVHLQAGRARLLLLDKRSGRVVGMDGEGEGE